MFLCDVAFAAIKHMLLKRDLRGYSMIPTIPMGGLYVFQQGIRAHCIFGSLKTIHLILDICMDENAHDTYNECHKDSGSDEIIRLWISY